MNKFVIAEKILVERFSRDSLIAIATIDDGHPDVRTVDSYYQDGTFYVITHLLSNKMKQIARNSEVAICGEWFTCHGRGENLGHVLAESNQEMMTKLRKAFEAWYGNGHVNENNPNTCLLRITLTNGILFDKGTRYVLDFINKVVKD